MKTWTLRRKGVFYATPSGDSHCGTGQMAFNYECWITCQALDNQGFVVDNKIVAECVPDHGIFLSCEKTGEDVANKVLARIVPNIRPFVTEIKVTVGAVELPADATFTWTREKAPAPRKVHKPTSTAEIMLSGLTPVRRLRKRRLVRG